MYYYKVTTSDWGSLLVVIPKSDEEVRLCTDYKIGVNQRLMNSNYPIRRFEKVLNSLRNSKFFCRRDLYRAYINIYLSTMTVKKFKLSLHTEEHKL